MGGNMAFEEIRSGNVENIMLWRESLSVMPDSHFFDLLRMYLGEIKTPYNKPNLIEQLSSFLRKEETKQTMISLLSKEDLELLTAIYLIPKITQKKLLKFFSTKTVSELYEHLMNLEERLLIFRTTDKETGKISLLRKADLLGERAGIGPRDIESIVCDPPPHYVTSLCKNFR